MGNLFRRGISNDNNVAAHAPSALRGSVKRTQQTNQKRTFRRCVTVLGVPLLFIITIALFLKLGVFLGTVIAEMNEEQPHVDFEAQLRDNKLSPRRTIIKI
mmetsp:Transcript_14363/g.34673  ORF Transcript_14363/g.34673 Transcript_14363/m.34673 type:complete len:101 (+) Transcript_14363:106-408(+)